MWIIDSSYRDGGIDLWVKDGNTVSKVHHDYNPYFLLHLHDPDSHYGMIEALEEQYDAKECSFLTIFGELSGYKVYAGREVAEAIEQQTRNCLDLFNVDVRRDQRFMAEQGLYPCGSDMDSRFTPEFSHNLTSVEINIKDNPALSCSFSDIEIIHKKTERLTGEINVVLPDFFSLIESINPDVILMANADTWMPKIQKEALKLGLVMPFSRNGKYRTMDSRSYWSYGKMEHKEAALIPDGRILIDTEQSFVYNEGGLSGVLMASRLSGLSPNLSARFTPGTLISSYEVYEAIKMGIAVPFRKSDPENLRTLNSLMAADRGGMMFQPSPGIYENVDEIDFTSMYPSIIVQSNLSPETIGHKERQGFLPTALKPLLELRIKTKQLKKTQPDLKGIDSILKWMLVTCFGYTGYKNAKFGRIEVHEGITHQSREILIQTKDIAEEMGFKVLHGIVDCLWVQGSHIEDFKARVEKETGLLSEVEHFNWLVFQPMKDGGGAYNRYFGRLSDGSIKVRGIAARRHDTPEFIRTMQDQMLTVMAKATSIAELDAMREDVRNIYHDAIMKLPDANPKLMKIERRISRTTYAHRCIEGAAVKSFQDRGANIAPGMKISYVVTDSKRYQVKPDWCAETFDVLYYRQLLEKAWAEIRYAFVRGNMQEMNIGGITNL